MRESAIKELRRYQYGSLLRKRKVQCIPLATAQFR